MLKLKKVNPVAVIRKRERERRLRVKERKNQLGRGKLRENRKLKSRMFHLSHNHSHHLNRHRVKRNHPVRLRFNKFLQIDFYFIYYAIFYDVKSQQRTFHHSPTLRSSSLNTNLYSQGLFTLYSLRRRLPGL